MRETENMTSNIMSVQYPVDTLTPDRIDRVCTVQYQMDTLTPDRIDRAFDRVKSETDIPGYKLVHITKEHFSAALKFANHVMAGDDLVTHALEWSPSADGDAMRMATFQHNLSLMLVDEISEEIVGIRATRVSKVDDDLGLEKMTDLPLKKLFTFLRVCNSRCDIFKHYETNEVIEFLGLAIARSHRNQGLGTKLMEAALKFHQYLDVKPTYIKSAATSNYTMKIYDKLDFELLSDNPYSEYKVDGEIVIRDTGENKSLKIYGKHLV